MIAILLGSILILGALVWDVHSIVEANRCGGFGKFYDFSEIKVMLSMFPIIIAVSLIYRGVTGDFAGYQEPELVQELKLVAVEGKADSESSENLFYVNVIQEGLCSYKKEVPNTSSEEGKTYNLVNVNNATVVEADVDEAILKVYEAKAKRSFWLTLGHTTETSYVFVVPEGTANYIAK